MSAQVLGARSAGWRNIPELKLAVEEVRGQESGTRDTAFRDLDEQFPAKAGESLVRARRQYQRAMPERLGKENRERMAKPAK